MTAVLKYAFMQKVKSR